MIEPGKRAEEIATCLVLSAEEVVSFHRVKNTHGKRTPDWHISLQDGRQVALEVTRKLSNPSYRILDGNEDVRIFVDTQMISHGDLDEFTKTISNKMKDKDDRGQLKDPKRESWLCIQPDDRASFELDTILKPPGRFRFYVDPLGRTLASHPYDDYAWDRPDLSFLMDEAEGYGFSEVWCMAESAYRPYTTLALRMNIEQREWVAWQLRTKFYWHRNDAPDSAITTLWPVKKPPQPDNLSYPPRYA